MGNIPLNSTKKVLILARWIEYVLHRLWQQKHRKKMGHERSSQAKGTPS